MTEKMATASPIPMTDAACAKDLDLTKTTRRGVIRALAVVRALAAWWTSDTNGKEEIRELKLKIEAMEKEMAKPKQKKPVQLAQQAIMSCPACCLFVRHFPVDKRHGDFWVVVNGQPGSPPVVDATEYESFGRCVVWRLGVTATTSRR